MERGPQDRIEDIEIAQRLEDMIGWKYDREQARITKSYLRKNFMDAINFIDEIAMIAEEQDHHPDIHLHKYKHVDVFLSTHSAGGVTQNDFDLAAAIDELN